MLEFYCLFSWTSWGVGVLHSAVFNSFHKSGWVWHDFGGPSEFRRGWVEPPNPLPLGTPLLTNNLKGHDIRWTCTTHVDMINVRTILSWDIKIKIPPRCRQMWMKLSLGMWKTLGWFRNTSINVRICYETPCLLINWANLYKFPREDSTRFEFINRPNQSLPNSATISTHRKIAQTVMKAKALKAS